MAHGFILGMLGNMLGSSVRLLLHLGAGPVGGWRREHRDGLVMSAWEKAWADTCRPSGTYYPCETWVEMPACLSGLRNVPLSLAARSGVLRSNSSSTQKLIRNAGSQAP